MVEEFGMSEVVGPLAIARAPLFFPLDIGGPREPTAEVKAEIRRLLDEAEGRAMAILSERSHVLGRIARLLIERETLERSELEEALSAARHEADTIETAASGGRRR
jgi:cell division protease FtsH